MKNYKICFMGPSGTGKTTLAKEVSKKLDIPFIDGSLTTLVEGSRGMNHNQILKQYKGKDSIKKHVEVLNKRLQMLSNYNNFICDRSFIDPLAYAIYENAHELPECDINMLFDVVNKIHNQINITHYVYIPYTYHMMDYWELEDNNKRITNPWFQLLISKCFDMALAKFGYNSLDRKRKNDHIDVYDKDYPSDSFYVSDLTTTTDKIPLLEVESILPSHRLEMIKDFVSK